MARTIRVVDITDLGSSDAARRKAAVQALGSAAEDMGFLCIVGGPVEPLTEPARIRTLLSFFALPAAEKQRLANSKHNPANANDYRGYYELKRGGDKPVLNGFDLGSGREPPAGADAVTRMLLEPNVWPQEALLPGWRATVEAHYREMEKLGRLIMEGLASHLGLEERYFEPFFGGGSSTLRFLQAPHRPDLTPDSVEERSRAVINGKRVRLGTGAHRDSGVLTLLWQEGSLQAQDPDGDWLDAPTLPRALNVNFGDVMAFWTGGRLQATPHRVIAVDRERFSIPFFFEPNVDATIQPIPGAPARPPIRYADHVFEKIKLFGTHSTARVEQAA
jgi:isopenicillin N synthase-like dioxygenase